MGVNKVKYGENVVLDISSDTVTADKLLQGYTAHDNTGALIIGTATQGGSVTQDQDGFIVLPPDGSGGGGSTGLEYEEGTWTPTADIARPTISFTSTHTERPIYVLISDISGEERNTDDMLAWAIVNWYDAFGFGLKVTSSQTNYARTQGIYKTAASFGAGTSNISSLDGNSGTTEMGYFLTKTAFYPYGNVSTRYWRAGRTYKWIAVWAPTT